MIRVRVMADSKTSGLYEGALEARLDPDLFQIVDEKHPKSKIEVLIYAPSAGEVDFSGFDSLRLVQSLWAGVEGLVQQKTLKVPLCRLVDRGLRLGMRDYVLGHVLADLLRIRHYAGLKSWEFFSSTTFGRGKNRDGYRAG